MKDNTIEINKLITSISKKTLDNIVKINTTSLVDLLTKDKDYDIYNDKDVSIAIRDVVHQDELIYALFNYEDYDFDDDDVVDETFVAIQDIVSKRVYDEYRKDVSMIMSSDKVKNDTYIDECLETYDFTNKSELYNTSEIIVDEMIDSRDDKVKARDAQAIKETKLLKEYRKFLIEEYVEVISNKLK